MRLPGGEQAEVDQKKLDAYLLSEAHPIGRWKALWFRSVGIRESVQLRDLLLRIAAEEQVVEHEESVYGTKYVVDGRFSTKAGREVVLRTVWIVGRESARPRLVTAYPGEE